MGLGASVCTAGPGAGPSAAAAVRPGVDGGGGVPGRAFGVLASFVVVNEHVREVIEEGRKLPVRLKLDLRYVAASVQAAQASFFGVLVFAGFVFLGLVSVPEATIATWTGKPPAMVELGPLDIPGALVKVSWVLGAFASLYMVTATAADKVAREEQLGPITAEVRGALNAAGALEKPTRSK